MSEGDSPLHDQRPIVAMLEAEKDALLQRRDVVASQLLSIDSDLAEVKAAIEAIKHAAWKRLSPRYEGRITIKEMALDVLGLYPNGTTTHEILRMIDSKFAARITRESLSPQLSRLRQDGLVELRGKTWFLATPTT